MRLNLVLLISLISILAVSACTQLQGNEIAFQSISKSHNGLQEANNYVITDEDEWADLWEEINSNVEPRPALPQVDFSKEMIVAVFMGTKSTGGYSIEVTKITETDSNLKILVKETSPGPNCIVTQSITYPYDVVKLQKIDKQAEFTTEKDAVDCA